MPKKKNQKVQKIEKFNLHAHDWGHFACYGDKAKIEIKIKSSAFFSALANTIIFSKSALLYLMLKILINLIIGLTIGRVEFIGREIAINFLKWS